MRNLFDKKKDCLLTVGVFLFFVIFWTRIYPIMVADPDDWTYISFSRQAIPAWKVWNPTRVFPETFMSFCGQLAAFIVLPIVKDWSHAMTYTFATVNAFVVTIYITLFDRLIKKLFDLSYGKRLFVNFCFICAHFLVFKTHYTNNSCVFMSHSLTTQMFYRAPMFISISFLFVCIIHLVDNKKINMNGGLLLWLFLAIFSNLATNVLIVAPAFIYILYQFTIEKKQKSLQIKKFVKENIACFVSLAFGIICLFFEFFGGRANDLPFDLKQSMVDTYTDVKTIIRNVNIPMAIFTLSIIIVFFIINYREKNYSRIKMMWIMFSSGCVCSVYVVLLFMRVGMHKLTRGDNVSVMAIFFLIAGAIALANILEKTNRINVFIPLLVYILFFNVTNVGRLFGNYFDKGGNLYLSAHSEYSTSADCYESNCDIINQFCQADKEGNSEIDLVLPEVLSKYSFAGNRIETTLYRQGIIRKHMKVNVNSNQ